jgi:hypothetical protein
LEKVKERFSRQRRAWELAGVRGGFREAMVVDSQIGLPTERFQRKARNGLRNKHYSSKH